MLCLLAVTKSHICRGYVSSHTHGYNGSTGHRHLQAREMRSPLYLAQMVHPLLERPLGANNQGTG